MSVTSQRFAELVRSPSRSLSATLGHRAPKDQKSVSDHQLQRGRKPPHLLPLLAVTSLRSMKCRLPSYKSGRWLGFDSSRQTSWAHRNIRCVAYESCGMQRPQLYRQERIRESKLNKSLQPETTALAMRLLLVGVRLLYLSFVSSTCVPNRSQGRGHHWIGVFCSFPIRLFLFSIVYLQHGVLSTASARLVATSLG